MREKLLDQYHENLKLMNEAKWPPTEIKRHLGMVVLAGKQLIATGWQRDREGFDIPEKVKECEELLLQIHNEENRYDGPRG